MDVDDEIKLIQELARRRVQKSREGSENTRPEVIADDQTATGRAIDGAQGRPSGADSPDWLSRIGPYDVVDIIGTGGMGVVYKAIGGGKTGLKAIKVARRNLDKEMPGWRERFEAEIRALVLCAHPNIALIIDNDTMEDGRPYFVMKYYEGALPITTYCEREGLSVRARLELFNEVCATVQAVHNLEPIRILHRDLKPTNVLVLPPAHDGKPRIRIVDFGLAASILAAAPAGGQPVAEVMQLPGVGTPEYASPQQLDGKQPTVQDDIYSLGALLFDVATEKRPFGFNREEEEPEQFLRRKKTPLLPEYIIGDLKRVKSSIREELALIICRAMEVEASDRFADVGTLKNSIDSLLHGQPLPIRKITGGYDVRKFVERHETLTAVATIAVLLTVGTAMSFGIRQAAKARAAEAKAREAEAKAATLEERAVGTLGGYAYSEPGQTLSPMWRVFGAEVRPEVESSPVLHAAILSWCQGGPLEKEKDSSVIFVCGELTQSRAADQLRTLAENGNTAAATALAAVEFTSAPAESFRWARVSAAHGSAAGEYFMGAHYLTGVGIARDDKKALRWFTEAASQDDLRAEGKLCSLLQNSEEPRWALFLDLLLRGPEIRLRRDLRSNRESYAWCSLAASNHNSGSGAEDIRQEAIRNREWVIREDSNAVAAGDMLLKQWQRRVRH